MKKRIVLSLLAVILGIFIYSCRKELNSLQEKATSSPNELTVKNARAYFKSYLMTKSAPINTATGEPEFRPLWHKAVEGSTSTKSFVEVPLQNPGLSFSLTAFDEDGNPIEGDKSIVKYVFKRLILYKDPRSEIITPYVLTYIPDRLFLEKNKFDATDVRITSLKRYSGYIQVNTMDNKPVSIYKYIDGLKILKMRSYIHNSSNDNKKQDLKTKGSIYVCTTKYCWTCGYVRDRPDLGVSCSEPEPCGQECGYEWVPDPPTPPTTPSNPGENENPGGGTPTPGSPNPVTTSALRGAIANKPFAFFDDVPCNVLKKFLQTAQFTPNSDIVAKLNTLVSNSVMVGPNQTMGSHDVARIQSINDAYSPIVNMDYFPIYVMEMPYIGTSDVRYTPDQFMHYIRTHLNELTDGTKTFKAYNANGVDDRSKWASTNPYGSVLALDIAGPDNASVITSYSSSNKWTFTTIYDPMYGEHPVSGNRDFSYTANPNGSYTFYTRGVDRLTSWDGQLAQSLFGIPFDQADGLWTDFQSKVKTFVQNHGGVALVEAPIKFRPDWNSVKDVIEGRKPLSTLSKDCPD